MLIRLIQALRGRSAALAILCKTATACKVLRYAWQNDGRVSSASLYRIPTAQHFEASVDACLFVAHLGWAGVAEALVFDSLQATAPERRVGLAGKDLVSDLATYEHLKHFEGLCPYKWRSGLKHDCASIMELEPVAFGRYRNKLGDTETLESTFVYPLLKSTDLAKGNHVPARAVLVTQRHPGEDTLRIATIAPHTWRYLQRHRVRLAARKSSIYTKGGTFAVFGVGDYSFAPWKVAVSALHLAPRFVLVPPHKERPVMFDDTCNYLSFTNAQEARIVADTLNSAPCIDFLRALTFPGTKRPLTVELLQRLNISAIAQEIGNADAWLKARKTVYPEANAEIELVLENPRRIKS